MASRVGLRTAVLVLVATTIPVAALFWASVVSKSAVEDRALAGLTATGKATVLQEQRAWDDAIQALASRASRPSVVSALQLNTPNVPFQAAQSALAAGPFADVVVYDKAGTPLGTDAMPGVTPLPFHPAGTATTTVGDPVTAGLQTWRQVSVAIEVSDAGPRMGWVVGDVDVSQLLGKPDDLAFGSTGKKFLITPGGLIVAGSAGIGTEVSSAVNRAVVAAGKPTTRTLFSTFFGGLTVESYQPVPGQKLGILVMQARSEALGSADRLSAQMRWVALAIGIIGAALAGSLGIFVGHRSRRLAASEAQLVATQAEATRRLEQFMDAMPVGVFVATPDGHPHYANREAARLLGRGALPGAGPEDLAEVYQAYRSGSDDLYPASQMPLVRSLEGEASHVDDMEIRKPEGSVVPVEVWGTPVRGNDGHVEFGITAFADVSERRQAADELQLLGSITANMSEGVVLCQATDATIVYTNSSFETMFGYEPGELIGRPVAILNAADRAGSAQNAEAMIESLRRGGAWRGEVHNVRKDGTTFWCAVNVTTIDHHRFGPVWIAVRTDITARRQAQEAQERLASIVEASREAILGETVEGVVTSWNRGAQTLLGYSPEEMIGAPVDALIPAEFVQESMVLRTRVARGLPVERYETVRVHKDGTRVDVSLTMSPIRDADGRIGAIALVLRDIRQEKRSRAALLEREEQLAAARDHALEASRLKSQFLANMSHEIRTPMNGVLGMAQLLLTGPLEAEQRRRVINLQRSAQSLLTIIDDILDFSKIEAGKMELESARFNLLDAAESVVGMLSSPATNKGLHLDLHVASGVPAWVTGDAVRIRQVLVNLLGNAVKFTGRGGATLSIRVVQPGILRFAVRDTGIGIDAAAQKHLLEPFSQGDASTTRRFGGTGLGLAICRQLVELMGGTLHFTSEPGVGTTFWFEVPLPEAEPGVAEPKSPAAGGHPQDDGGDEAGRTGVERGARILLADDAELNQEVGKGLLESLGYTVDTVASGAEAVEAVQRRHYAAVVMDCLMPEMDGYEATRRIRSLPGPVKHIPIIALTAAAMAGDRERCLAAGMDDYVSKPLDLEMLAAALARCRPGSVPTPPGPPEAAPDPPPDLADDEPGDDPLLERLQMIGKRLPADAFGRICDQFVATTPDLIASLGAAVRAKDTGSAIALAHRLKGSMATFGVERLSRLAERVERLERSGAEPPDDILAAMEAEFVRARALIETLVAGGFGD